MMIDDESYKDMKNKNWFMRTFFKSYLEKTAKEQFTKKIVSDNMDWLETDTLHLRKKK